MNRHYRSDEQNIIDRKRVQQIMQRHDQNRELKFIIICHGRKHGIPVELTDIWDQSVVLDGPANRKTDKSMADLYLDISEPIPDEYSWLQYHFDLVICQGCPWLVLIDWFSQDERELEIAVSKGQAFDNNYCRPLAIIPQIIYNLLWLTHKGGHIILRPYPFTPEFLNMYESSIEQLFKPYASVLEIIPDRDGLVLKKIRNMVWR
jgi:hypothetical protein